MRNTDITRWPVRLIKKVFSGAIMLLVAAIWAPASMAQTTYTVCSKQGSELDLNNSRTSGMRAKLSNGNYFGPGGTVAPEQMAFQSLFSINSTSLAACDIFIGGGGPENLSVAETQAIRTWVNSGNRFVIAGCDSSTQLLCGPNGLQRNLTNVGSGSGVSLNFSLAYNPLTCGGVAGVNTFGGAATLISTLGTDTVLATHNGGFSGQPAAIAPDLVSPKFLMTADPDMYGSAGNGVIGTSAIASSDQAIFVLNSFKFAADALSGRLLNPQCPVDYNSAGDLEIGLAASAPSASVGGTIEFEVEVANTGATSVGDVAATFQLPVGFSHVSDSGAGAYDDTTGLWSIGTLSPGNSVTLTVTATATAAGSVLAQAEITGANLPDIDSAPNSSFAEDDLADGLNDDDEASLNLVVLTSPVTVDDVSAGHGPGSPATLDVLANDTDSDGTIVATTVQIVGTSGPGVPLAVYGEGTWTIDPASGAIRFTPEPDFKLDPTPIQYTVEDNEGNVSLPAMVRLDYDLHLASLPDAPNADTCFMPSLYIANGASAPWPTRPGVTVTASTNMSGLATNTDRTFGNVGNKTRTVTEETRWQKNGGDISLSLSFSQAVPADEIALLVYDIGLGSATPYEGSFSLSVVGGAGTADFAASGIAEHNLTLRYAGETGDLVKSDPSHIVRESAVLVGQGSASVSQLTLTSGNVAAADFLGIALFPVTTCDQSDAPVSTTSYGAAQHVIVDGLSLGTAIDAEDAPQSAPNADGDDLDIDGNDDDGVTFPPLTQGQATTISVDVTQASANDGYLQGWIDWNGDGDFADAGEQVASDLQSASAGTSTISVPVTVPANATSSQTFARFRWSTTSGLDSTTAAPDGEVEDYAVTIQPGGIDVSGRVFEDNGAGVASAHDGLFAGDEAGLGGIRIEARDAGGAVIASAQTDGDGLYLITLPNGAAGTPVTLYAALAGADWRYMSGVPGDLPAPANTLAGDGEVSFTPVLGTDYSGVDIGEVRDPDLEAPRLAGAVPGQSVTLAHTFTARTAGQVVFSLAALDANPANAFTQTVFADNDCDGVIGAADTPLAAPVDLLAGDKTCLAIRVGTDAGAPPAASLEYTLAADFTFHGTAMTAQLANKDLVTVSQNGALELTKRVCNSSLSACDLASGAGFSSANSGAPGDVLVYLIGFANPGPDPIDDVDVYDDTPAFSALTATAPGVVAAPSGLTCALASPAVASAGYTGDLHWACTGLMAPGQTGAVSFEVSVDN